jgi:hypothetical protein
MRSGTQLKGKRPTAVFRHNLIISMEQCIYYIFVYYRGHLLKGVAIFDNTGTKLQQNFCLIEQKMVVMNTVIIKFEQ